MKSISRWLMCACGDIHTLIAETYLKFGDKESAVKWLEKMTDYELNIRTHFSDDMLFRTPLLRDAAPFMKYYRNGISHKGCLERLLSKLTNKVFDELKNNTEYKAILERVFHEMDTV